MVVAHPSKVITGAAGEYFAAAELSARGWIATISVRGAPGTDVLAQHAESGRLIAVQTKAAGPGMADFQLHGSTKKDVDAEGNRIPLGDEIPAKADNEWFVFVGLKEPGERPDYFVVPRNVVAVLIYSYHVHLMRTLKKGGVERVGAAHRRLRRQDLEPYRDQFQLLLDSSGQAPWRVPDRLLEAVAAVGGPPDTGLPQRLRQRRVESRENGRFTDWNEETLVMRQPK
jgi:hypothetical protein